MTIPKKILQHLFDEDSSTDMYVNVYDQKILFQMYIHISLPKIQIICADTHLRSGILNDPPLVFDRISYGRLDMSFCLDLPFRFGLSLHLVLS